MVPRRRLSGRLAELRRVRAVLLPDPAGEADPCRAAVPGEVADRAPGVRRLLRDPVRTGEREPRRLTLTWSRPSDPTTLGRRRRVPVPGRWPGARSWATVV